MKEEITAIQELKDIIKNEIVIFRFDLMEDENAEPDYKDCIVRNKNMYDPIETFDNIIRKAKELGKIDELIDIVNDTNDDAIIDVFQQHFDSQEHSDTIIRDWESDDDLAIAIDEIIAEIKDKSSRF